MMTMMLQTENKYLRRKLAGKELTKIWSPFCVQQQQFYFDLCAYNDHMHWTTTDLLILFPSARGN